MNNKKRRPLTLLLLPLLFLCHNSFAINTSNPYSVHGYGNFTRMLASGKAPGIVSLQSMQGHKHMYCLGALGSLQGEITMINGNILISRGTDDNNQAGQVTAQDKATLLATAYVKYWTAVPIPHSLNQASFENFVLQHSTKLGISNEAPFPFIVRGEIKKLRWHVVNGLIVSEHNTGSHPRKKTFDAENTHGTLLGFYTSKQLEGIISHPHERFHLHFADASLNHAGHVENYIIGSKATLFLPKK